MEFFRKIDQQLVVLARKRAIMFAHFALFVVYFWFGALKVFCDHGAANPLVVALLKMTMPFLEPGIFLVGFGAFEMIIGLLFLLPRLSRQAVILLAIHIGMTVLPLVVLPALTWQGLFVPTLEGQYIIKNILIVALAIVIVSNLTPLKGDRNQNK